MSDHNLPPWGIIIPLHKALVSGKLDLTKDEYTFGTGDSCDYQIFYDSSDPNLDNAIVEQHSEVHFRLEKDDTESETLYYIHDLSEHGTYVNGKKIGKNNKRPLEPNSDISLVSVDNQTFIFIVQMPEDLVDIPNVIKGSYIISKTLGKGAFGKVRLLFTHDGTAKVAMKCVDKMPYSGPTDAEVLRETDIMIKLKHPCIIEIIETHNVPHCLYIIMELAEAGTLSSRLRQLFKLEESVTRIVIHQILLAVEYLHKQGITHRDLKPDNILLASWSREPLIKVTDFGVSKAVNHQTLMKTLAGTPCYIAPEIWKGQILRGDYSNAVDVWSVGIILYQCLIGDLPIRPAGRGQMRHDLMETYTIQTKFDNYAWTKMPLAEDLGRRLLQVEATDRILVKDALKHEWLENEHSQRKVEELTGLALEYSGKAMSERRSSLKSTTLVKKRLQELGGSKQELSSSNGNEVDNKSKSDFIKRRVQELGASFTKPDQAPSNGQGQQSSTVHINLRRGSNSSLLDVKDESTLKGEDRKSRVRTQSLNGQISQRTDSPQELSQSLSQSNQKLQESDKNIKLQLYIRSPEKQQGFQRRQSTGGSVVTQKEGPFKKLQTRSQSLSPLHKERGQIPTDQKGETETLPPTLPKNPPPVPAKKAKPPKPRKTRRSRAQQQQQQNQNQEQPTTEQSLSAQSSETSQQQQQKEADKQNKQDENKPLTPTKQILRRSPFSPVLQRSNSNHSPTRSDSQNTSPTNQSASSQSQSPTPKNTQAKPPAGKGSKSPEVNGDQPDWIKIPASPSQIRKQQLLQRKKQAANGVADSKSDSKPEAKVEVKPNSNQKAEVEPLQVFPSPSQIRKQQVQQRKLSQASEKTVEQSKSPVASENQSTRANEVQSPSNKEQSNSPVNSVEQQTSPVKQAPPKAKSPELNNNNQPKAQSVDRQIVRQAESPVKEAPRAASVPNDKKTQAQQEEDDDEEQRLKVSVRDRILAAERAAKENQEAEQLERERLLFKRRSDRSRERELRSSSPKSTGERQTVQSEERAQSKTGQKETTLRTNSVQETSVDDDNLEVKLTQFKKKDQQELTRLEREREEQLEREQDYAKQQQAEQERREAVLRQKESVLAGKALNITPVKRVSVTELFEQEAERLTQEREKELKERDRLDRLRLKELQSQTDKAKLQSQNEKAKLQSQNEKAKLQSQTEKAKLQSQTDKAKSDKLEQDRLKQEKAERDRKIQERLEKFRQGGKTEIKQGPSILDEDPRLIQVVDPEEKDRLERLNFIESQLKSTETRPKETPPKVAPSERHISLSAEQQERIAKYQARKLKHQGEEERIAKQKKQAEEQIKQEQSRLDRRIEKQKSAEQARIDERILRHKQKEQARLGLQTDNTPHTPKQVLPQRKVPDRTQDIGLLQQQLLDDEHQLSVMTQRMGDQHQLGDQQPDDEYEKLLEITKQLEERQRQVDQLLMEKKKQLEDRKKQIGDGRLPSTADVSDYPLLNQMATNPKNAVIKKRAEEIIGRNQKPEASIFDDDDEVSHIFKPVHPAPVKSIPSAKTRHPSGDLLENIPTARPVPRLSKDYEHYYQDSDSEDSEDYNPDNSQDYDEVIEAGDFQTAMMQDSYLDHVDTRPRFSPTESYLQKAQDILRARQAPQPTQDHSYTYIDEPASHEMSHNNYGTPSHPNVESIEERIRQLRLQAAPPPPPQTDVNPMAAAGQILAKRITDDDVANKLAQLQEQFAINSMRRQEREDMIEPDPEPESQEPTVALDDVLVDLGTHQDEPEVVLNGLVQLYRWLQTPSFTAFNEALHAVMVSMTKNLKHSRIQLQCSSCFLLFLKGDCNYNLTDINRSDMLGAMLDGLDFHDNDANLTRRCLLCLEHYDIPYDVIHDIPKLVKILVRIVTPPHENKFLKGECIQMAIPMLEKLSLPHSDLNKPFDANLGALTIHAMLEIITERLAIQECDDIMEAAWSIIWNVTHEIPENCVRFMTSSGLDLFLDCIKVFHDRPNLHLNMVGVMTNLAEGKYVRGLLMKPESAEVIASVWELMDCKDAQLRYLSCSVMARLVADGAAAWKLEMPTHRDTCERIVQSIGTWNMNKSGAIYRGRTLAPILRLVTMTSSPESQYWAAWTICSLVRSDVNKYGLLLDREGGRNKLETLVRSNTSDVIKELANKTLELFSQYKGRQQ